MYGQQYKDIYFWLNRYLVLPNTWLARWRFRRPPEAGYAVNLGSGGHPVPGMVNADGYIMHHPDVWIDLRNPLPFPDNSCRLVYCCHVIEHLFPGEAIALLTQTQRILRPDGVARIVVPCFEHAMRIARGECEDHFARSFDDPAAQAINHLFVEGQHRYGYCTSIIQQFAKEAGFSRADIISTAPDVPLKTYGEIELGQHEPPGSLVAELHK